MIPAALALPGTARRFAGAVAAVCLGVLLVAGCGRGGGLVAVSGTVSSGGAAVADAEMTFVSESGTGRAAATKSLATGAFATRVLPGRYRVTVFKPLLGGPDMHRSALPERFMHPPDTPLAADVPAKGPVKLRIVLDDPPICEPAADAIRAACTGAPR